jgi:hypothetical protein
MGRVLNSEKNMEIYLTHVREQMDILANGKILDGLYRYGNTIAAFASKDDYFLYAYNTVEEYTEMELTEDTSKSNTLLNPFLPSLRARLEEVQKQLDAIDSGTLPRNGEYDSRSICPDWRNPGVEMYSSFMTEDCPNAECSLAGFCFSVNCGDDGEFMFPECFPAEDLCSECYPYSKCGSAQDVVTSGTFVESDVCGPELAECASAAPCFDHLSGQCAFDGEILRADCFPVAQSCAPCFPNSRCGSGELAPGIDAPDDSGSAPATSNLAPENESPGDSGLEPLPPLEPLSPLEPLPPLEPLDPLSSARGSNLSSEWISKLMALGLLWSWMVVAA